MRKVLVLTALVLGLSGGVALADRDRGDRGRHEYRGNRGDHRVNHSGNYRGNRGDHRVTHRGNSYRGDHRVNHRGNYYRGDYRSNYRGGSRVIVRDRPYYRQHVRRPIYVSRPVIHTRYYNYYRRPSVIFENYDPMPGYYWVKGHWTWNGFEWIWTPGYYQPDPNYVDYGY